MPHETELIGTIALGLTAAFIGGFLAARLRLPPIVGYLLAGVAVGPFTPGFVADLHLAPQLAEIGVILLMFGVGIHFSVRELMAVRWIAIPGAVGQIAVATTLGVVVARWWGWSFGGGLVLGLALSVASTVVLLRALMERSKLDSAEGRAAVGWLIVEDLVTVLVLVLLPAFAGMLGGTETGADDRSVLVSVGITLGKVVILVAIMIAVGGRAVPWLLVQVARTGSRELFILAILSVALGVAYGAATLFDVSLALGAFLAGLVISEPDLSHKAAEEALPLRDAFAVLFFVSVGMLLEPAFLFDEPERVLVVLGVVIFGKGLAALGIILVLGHPIRTGLVVAAGLAQIGEFSFILSELGRDLKLLPEEGHSLILAGALVSITLNPFVFYLIGPLESWVRRHPELAAYLERRSSRSSWLPESAPADVRSGHVVLCGHGRVGQVIADLLSHWSVSYVVIEQDRQVVDNLRSQGVPALFGDAANSKLLEKADVASAAVLILAIPDPPAIRHIARHAQRVNPSVNIVARTHSEGERDFLMRQGIGEAVLGELELALEMARYAMSHIGIGNEAVDGVIQAKRLADRPLQSRLSTVSVGS